MITDDKREREETSVLGYTMWPRICPKQDYETHRNRLETKGKAAQSQNTA